MSLNEPKLLKELINIKDHEKQFNQDHIDKLCNEYMNQKKNRLGHYKRSTVNDICDNCSICACAFDLCTYQRNLVCGHKFHKKCIDIWAKRQNTCPICRSVMY
jgi:hypothetical protein